MLAETRPVLGVSHAEALIPPGRDDGCFQMIDRREIINWELVRCYADGVDRDGGEVTFGIYRLWWTRI